MRRFFLLLAFAALSVPGLCAQTPDPPMAAAPSCPSTATLDLLITAIDAAVSGPADKDRTCFRALFLPGARLIPIRIAKDGAATPAVLTVDDWINAVKKRGSMMVIEKQLKVKTETWDHLAHLWSTYETKLGDDPNAGDRGINSIQAVYDGKLWHVQEILWQAETPTNPVPAKYLP